MQFRNWYCSDGNDGLSSAPIAVGKGSRKGGDWAASRVTVFDRRGHCVNRSFLNCSRRRIRPRTLFVLTPLVRSHSELRRRPSQSNISLFAARETLKSRMGRGHKLSNYRARPLWLIYSLLSHSVKGRAQVPVSKAMPGIVCKWSLDQHQNLLVTDSFQSMHFYCTVYNLTICTLTIYTFIGHTFTG